VSISTTAMIGTGLSATPIASASDPRSPGPPEVAYRRFRGVSSAQITNELSAMSTTAQTG
jgi:hypothetical protein